MGGLWDCPPRQCPAPCWKHRWLPAAVGQSLLRLLGTSRVSFPFQLLAGTSGLLVCPFGCDQRLCASPVRVTLLPGVLSVFWNRVTKWLVCLNVIILNFRSGLKRGQKQNNKTKQSTTGQKPLIQTAWPLMMGFQGPTLHCPRARDSPQPAHLVGLIMGLPDTIGVGRKSGPRESVSITDRPPPQIYQSPGGGDLGPFFNHSFPRS